MDLLLKVLVLEKVFEFKLSFIKNKVIVSYDIEKKALRKDPLVKAIWNAVNEEVKAKGSKATLFSRCAKKINCRVAKYLNINRNGDYYHILTMEFKGKKLAEVLSEMQQLIQNIYVANELETAEEVEMQGNYLIYDKYTHTFEQHLG